MKSVYKSWVHDISNSLRTNPAAPRPNVDDQLGWMDGGSSNIILSVALCNQNSQEKHWDKEDGMGVQPYNSNANNNSNELKP